MPKIVRVGELKDYTIIENACLRDMTLDIAERGLLVTMLSLPDNWDFSGIGLTSILPCGKSKVFSTLKKLEKAGYLKRERIYIDGKITDWEYRICGRPIFKEDACEENDSENINDENVDNPSLSVDNSVKNVDNISNSVDNYVDNSKNNTMRLYSDSKNSKNSENNAASVSALFSENLFLENQEVGFQEVENLEVENRYDNKIYNNKIYNNQVCNNQIYNNQSINQSNTVRIDRIDGTYKTDTDRMRHLQMQSEKTMNDYEIYKKIIKSNISFDDLCYSANYDEIRLFNEILEIMTETVAFNKKTININGSAIPAEVVKSRFLKTTYDEIQYVLETFSKNTTRIKNIRGYLISMIYNAGNTINSYYKAEVQHDFHGYG